MKVVLLAGGFGSRISEDSQFKPKPMSEIGGMIFKYDGLSGKRYYERFDYIKFLNNK